MWELGDIHWCLLNVRQAQIYLRKIISGPQDGIEPKIGITEQAKCLKTT